MKGQNYTWYKNYRFPIAIAVKSLKRLGIDLELGTLKGVVDIDVASRIKDLVAKAN